MPLDLDRAAGPPRRRARARPARRRPGCRLPAVVRPPGGSGSAPTAIPSAPASRSSWAACASKARRVWPAIRTATWPSTPWRMRCSARPAWATWAGSSRPTRGRPAGIDSRVLLAGGRGEGPRRRLGPGQRGPDDRRRPAAGWRRFCPRWARRSRRLSASMPSAVNVKASTGNLGGSEGAGRSISASAIAWLVPAAPGRASASHRRAGAGGRRMTIRLHDTMAGAVRELRAARARTTSASTAAARRSTGRPTSATSARSCSTTCSSATCDIAACKVTWVMNVTDVDDRIIKGAERKGPPSGSCRSGTARFSSRTWRRSAWPCRTSCPRRPRTSRRWSS